MFWYLEGEQHKWGRSWRRSPRSLNWAEQSIQLPSNTTKLGRKESQHGPSFWLVIHQDEVCSVAGTQAFTIGASSLPDWLWGRSSKLLLLINQKLVSSAALRWSGSTAVSPDGPRSLAQNRDSKVSQWDVRNSPRCWETWPVIKMWLPDCSLVYETMNMSSDISSSL